jgi:uncharacterized damage-inducible protein DinB
MVKRELTAELAAAWVSEFRKQKAYIDGAVAQLSDEQFRARPAPNVNSAAMLIKHLAGNLRSRWTDWLTTDGEKPDRDRDREFVDEGESRAELMERYEQGWKLLFGALGSLSESDLSRTVTIRSEAHSVPLAINRQLAHAAYHAGQIMLIARSLAGDAGWKWQTVAPGRTAEFNQQMRRKHGSS